MRFLLSFLAFAAVVSGPVGAETPSVHAEAFDWRQVLGDSQKLPPEGVDEQLVVTIGGIRQSISVRGADRENPLLLYLHGGPGSPMMPGSWSFQRPLEDFFTVVQWDQRGAGKTFALNRNKVDPDMTIAQVQADAEELIAYLLKRYEKKKVVLLGHSWGGIIGLRVALHRPDLLHAYVGVGQVVNGRRNEEVSYQLTLEQARRDGNAEAIRELEAIAPYPAKDYVTGTGTERRWVRHYRGMIYAHRVDDEVGRWRMSPQYTEADVKAAIAGQEASEDILWHEVGEVNFDDVRRLDCPLILFAGAEDRTTPTVLAKEFFDRVDAPTKEYFEYPKVAHYIVSEAPGRFLFDMVRSVRPLAQ